MRILTIFAVAAALAAGTDPNPPSPQATTGRESSSDGGWSRFRGPNGTGVAETSALPSEFGPATNVVWKTTVPSGHSSPVLTAAHIFMTGVDSDKLVVLALDRASGRELWRRDVPRVRRGRIENVNGPASPSPVTDGDGVYAFFQDFGLIAFTADGKERWRLPLGPFNMFYGFGASPIVVDGMLMLPVDQDTGSYLLGVDAKSGKERYRIDRPGVISGYSTPTVYEPKGGPKQVLIPESFQLSAYDVKDGHRVWWVRGLACEMKSVVSIEIAGGPPALDKMLSPKYGFSAFDGNRDGKLDAKEWDVMRAMLASENGLLAVKLGGTGDVTSGAIKWKYQRPVPQVPSTLLYKGVLFMINDSGILLSIDPATGSVLKQGRLKGAIDKYFASPVGADGKVFLVSQDGTASVVDAKAQWEILSVNPLDDEVFATPAIANGQIYIRTKSTLYAFASPSR